MRAPQLQMHSIEGSTEAMPASKRYQEREGHIWLRRALRPHSTTPTSTPTRETRRHPRDDPREDVGVGVVECGLYRALERRQKCCQ